MTKRTTAKKALIFCMVALILSFTLLDGTTLAWFSDSVESGNNQIIAGNLDIELEYRTANNEWETVQGTTQLFKQNTLWEPGHTEVVYLKLTNKGTLALDYKLQVYAAAETTGINVNGETFKLSEKLVHSMINPIDASTAYTRAEAIAAANAAGRITLGSYPVSKTEVAAGTTQCMALVVYMPETVGNEANYKTGTAVPTIDLAIRLEATQATVESDSWDNQYDANADGMPDHPEFDRFIGTVETVSGGLITTVGENQTETVKEQQTIEAGGIKVTYPAGVLTTDTAPTDKEESDYDTADAKQGFVYTGNASSNVSVSADGNVLGVYELTLPVSRNNTVFIKIEEQIEAYQTVLHVWHNGTELTNRRLPSNATVPENRDAGYFTYDYETGKLTMWVLHSSEVSVEYKGMFAGGTGTAEDPYLISSAQHFANIYYVYSGNHFKLVNDITVSSAYTAGWVRCATLYLANGTFDGNNHTITVSDSTYDVNLFYKVTDATIKNLNVVLDYSLTVYCYNTVTFDKVNVSGGFTASGNEGAYVIYDFANTLNFTDCVADAEMSGTSYNAVFVGYVNWPQTSVGTLNFTRCENRGTLVCNYAAMFIGNPNAYDIVCNVVDCVNSGTIQATNTNQVLNYYYAVTSNCYRTFTINGTVYNDIADGRSSAPSCYEDTLVTTTGQAIQGPQNTGMALTQNADGTFTITPATIDGKTVDHYTVYVGVYAALKAGGSDRNYATETISASAEPMVTTLQNLKFVDTQWVEAHPEAVEDKLAGNVTYTLNGETYYMLVNPETDTLNGNVKAPQMIYVVAYDASNQTLASAQLLGNIA